MTIRTRTVDSCKWDQHHSFSLHKKTTHIQIATNSSRKQVLVIRLFYIVDTTSEVVYGKTETIIAIVRSNVDQRRAVKPFNIKPYIFRPKPTNLMLEKGPSNKQKFNCTFMNTIIDSDDTTTITQQSSSSSYKTFAKRKLVLYFFLSCSQSNVVNQLEKSRWRTDIYSMKSLVNCPLFGVGTMMAWSKQIYGTKLSITH